MGAGAGAAKAKAELRTRAQSWASPPATRGWLSRCGQRPLPTGPWGRRRSACRPRTGSRRAPTGPRWTADGSGGGTRGRCSRGRPGPGAGKGTVRGSTAGGRRPSMVKAPRGPAHDAPTRRGGRPRMPRGGFPATGPGQPGAGHCRGRGSSDSSHWRLAGAALSRLRLRSDWRVPVTHTRPWGLTSSSGLGVVGTTAPRVARDGRGGRHGGRAPHPPASPRRFPNHDQKARSPPAERPAFPAPAVGPGRPRPP